MTYLLCDDLRTLHADLTLVRTIRVVTAGKPAQFVISIDLEMSWGAVHHGRPHDRTLYLKEREVVADLLALMSDYDISATWAIVGHLFLGDCSPVDGRNHYDIIRPTYRWLDDDWYDLDPATNVDTDPTWYGPDLVAAIRSCPTRQEIGSHSFGHLMAGDAGCSADAFRSDLVAARAVAERVGVDLRSFVYPRNSVGHLDVLADEGFLAFRSQTPQRFPGLPPWRRRLMAAVDSVRPIESATVAPVRRGRLVEIPQTYLFDPGSRTANRVGTKAWSMLVRRRLRHATRTSSLFHLWFHTHNLASNQERAHEAMANLFREAHSHIDAGRLENLTMGQVADRMADSPDPETT